MDTIFAESLPPIYGNFNQLQQVVFNLITNACHAMTGGGSLTIKTEKFKGGGCLTVQDTGYGIPSAYMKKIFDPFFTTKEKGAGTGLGLAVVYWITSDHGGHVEVKTQEKDGTTFLIYLPLAGHPS